MVDTAAAARTARTSRWLDVAVPAGGPATLLLFFVAGGFFEPGRLGANPTMSGEGLLRVLAGEIATAPAASATYLLAALAMLLFAGALWDHLRVAPGAQWPAVLAVGGAIVLAVEMVDYARAILSAMVAVDAGDPVTVSVLATSGWEAARLIVASSVAMMFGAGVAGLRGALPRWFSILSLVGAAGALASLVATGLPVGFLEASPAGGLAAASLLWTFPAGIVMAVRAARSPAGPAGRTPVGHPAGPDGHW